ncbi:MAG: response regulator transcription factor [Chloroflexi bacterium]|nr:response regulator transcription factor [Chloroflexota bacterium]MCI0574934.1 response regulator transcription factor [Chloroflexota bacterium]MCI0645844.1 response regulator transcription factor [Chloroflexota bacterium]MCI0725699.1 response regulator transcription factor [Chloroflexota bacterium]
MNKIRVVLAEDHHVVRGALAALLAKEPDIAVVGEVADATVLLNVVKALKPDVLLLDAHMPGHRVLETVQTLRNRHPELQILVLSAYRRREYAIGLLEVGAAGYLLKDDPQETLIQAVRIVARGQQWFSPRVMEILIKSASERNQQPISELTKREIEVLRLIASGYKNAEIGAKLTLTEQTVKNYVRRIFRKLDVETRVEAVLYALSQNLVSPEDLQD